MRPIEYRQAMDDLLFDLRFLSFFEFHVWPSRMTDGYKDRFLLAGSSFLYHNLKP